MEKTWGNGYRLLQGRFLPHTRRKFFTMRMISHWNNLCEELDPLTLDLSERGAGPSCLDHAFTKKVWTRWSLRFPSRLVLYDSMILPYSLHFPGVLLVCKACNAHSLIPHLSLHCVHRQAALSFQELLEVFIEMHHFSVCCFWISFKYKPTLLGTI